MEQMIPQIRRRFFLRIRSACQLCSFAYGITGGLALGAPVTKAGDEEWLVGKPKPENESEG
jgi:hypothetical protein